MKSLSIILIGLLIFASSAKAENHSRELRQLWKIAEGNMPGLKARRREARAVRDSLRALPNRLKPDLDLSGGYSVAANQGENDHGALARITARWTLWDGGRNFFRSKMLTGSSDAADRRREAALLEIKSEITRLYFDILFVDALAGVQEKRAGQYRRLILLIQRRVRIGTAAASDLEQVRISLLKLNHARELSLRTANLLREQMALMTGTSPAVVGRLSSAGLDVQDSPLMKPALLPAITVENLPRFRAYRARLRSLEAAGKLARRELYWPSLEVELHGGYGPRVDALDPAKPEVGAAFRFRFPFLSAGNRRARLSARLNLLAAARLDLKDKMLREKSRLRSMLHGLSRDRVYLRNLRNLRARSQRNLLRGYRDFRRGLRSPGDMTGAVNSHFKLEIEFLRRLKSFRNMTTELGILRSYAAEGQTSTRNLRPEQ